jgi:TonB dependent receptor/Carboxypeptidase regulatory-like domain/TonB-dependent Receptor Plug Domain
MTKRILAAVGGMLLVASLSFAQNSTPTPAPASVPPATSSAHGNITGAVADSATGQPLTTAEVVVKRDGKFVAGTFTDAFGRYTHHNLPPGTYSVAARLIGFRIQTQTVTVAGNQNVEASFRLAPAPLELAKVEVFASAPSIVDVRTGDQTFQADEYHGSPVTTTSQILQQSIAGAARAPTGEVHIRGQHAEYTYYVDGVPVPLGISGSLNELFDPAIINHIDFKTGSWDAEYGNKNAAVIDVATRIPSGGWHGEVAGYGGSFASNGQSFSLSTANNTLGMFVSGSRQTTDMRREPVLADPSDASPINFHNHGDDYSGFGKLQFIPRPTDILNLDVDGSATHFEVPYDSTGGVVADDNQKDSNGFVNFSWRHHSGDEAGTGKGAVRESFVALLYRSGKLTYTPGPADDPQFIFYPDSTPYNLSEDRTFQSFGTKLDYLVRPKHGYEYKIGAQLSATKGHENFSTVDAAGAAGPGSNSDLTGSDIGVYAQASLAPTELIEFRPGVRYDAHRAPFAGTQTQVSPRIRVSLFPRTGDTIWLYYGRLFIPTNIEDLRAVTSVADSGVVAEPTLPERDDFYEAGYVHRFPAGVVGRFSIYEKRSSPGIDDNTVPGSAIVTSVNIDRVRITGIEGVVEVKPGGPFSGYVNAALNHAYGHGPITGGFFPADTPQGDFDLDHDQRLSIVASATYAPQRWFVSASAIYGSGLTNGNDPDASYGTGLFDFNPSIKVDPSTILNASAGLSFVAGRTIVHPEISVDNALDKHYLLKGAFFSGASVGRPRSVQAKVTVNI